MTIALDRRYRRAPPPRVGWTNTRERYGRVAQAFHWTIAALFLLQYPGGIVMHELPATPEWIGTKVWLYSAHKTAGIVIFALALARVAWALANPHPRLLNAEKRWEAFAAASIHWLLYAAILLVPLSGMLIHWTTVGYAPVWLPFPHDVGLPATDRAAAIAFTTHKALTITVLAAIALHIGGALKHHLIDRDATLRRMLPGSAPALPTLPPPSMQPSTAKTLLAGAGGLVAVGGAALLVGVLLAPPASERASAASDPIDGAAEAAAPVATAEADAVGAPPRWIVVPEASDLAITVQQLGSPVAGRFAAFEADIRFDPDDLEASRVSVTIPLSSLTLGSVTDQALGLLGAANVPEARFEATEFERVGEGGGGAGGSFVARGTLTLAGIERPVALPFDLRIEDDRATMTGRAEIDRLDWSVGASEYPDGGSLGLIVVIDVAVEAVRDGA